MKVSLFLLAASSLFAVAAPPLTLEKSIPLPGVKGGFDLMAVDSPGQRLFLCAEENNTVEVLDLAAGQRVKSLHGFAEPKWAVYRAEQQRLYISQASGAVAVLDSRTFAPVKEYKFREKANNLRFDAATGELFVGIGKTFGAIAIVDTAKDATTGEIPLADFPKQFEVEGGRIFVNVPKANHIAVIDRAKREVVATWLVAEAKDNVPMGFDRAQHRLFVGCEPEKFVVFDSVAGKSIASLDIAAESDGIHYDAKRHRIYVSCGAGSLDVVAQTDADHYALATSVPTVKGAGTSWFSPELDRLYLAVPAHDGQPAELRVYQPSSAQ
jgi:DNA-binding beta-propeller fold protein YncE